MYIYIYIHIYIYIYPKYAADSSGPAAGMRARAVDKQVISQV